MKLLSCNSNIGLSKEIARKLNLSLTKASIRKFSDEEIFVEINENVRGQDVYVIQSTSKPANDNLLELLISIDALKRASAKQITAVIPYFGYARQDRKPGPRTPITAKLVANLISTSGASRVLTIDLHAGQVKSSLIYGATGFLTSCFLRSCSSVALRLLKLREQSSQETAKTCLQQTDG